MAHTSEIDDVPPDQVDQVVHDFKDAGATSVTKTQQANGNFTVVATFDATEGVAKAGTQPSSAAGTAPKVEAKPSGTSSTSAATNVARFSSLTGASLKGVSTNRNVTKSVTCLRRANIDFICRYYSATTTDNQKRLTRAEAEAISVAGMQIVAVYRDSPTHVSYFSSSRGHLDAINAYHYGNVSTNLVAQPFTLPWIMMLNQNT